MNHFKQKQQQEESEQWSCEQLEQKSHHSHTHAPAENHAPQDVIH